jgi:hypothetical protein
MLSRINDQTRLQNMKQGEIRLAMLNLNSLVASNGKHTIRCKNFIGQITAEAFAFEILRRRWMTTRKDTSKYTTCKKLPLKLEV